MSTNNYWLYSQLRKIPGLNVLQQYSPLIKVNTTSNFYKIYTPDSSEYMITVDIVQKVKAMGGNLISYPSSWCRASSESIAFGKENDVEVVPHGRLFEILKS